MKIKLLQFVAILAIGILPFAGASCSAKGMYMAKNGVPVPYDISFATKSDYEEMDVKGPGYEYKTVTVKKDQTEVAKKGIDAALTYGAAGLLADYSKAVDANKAKTAMHSATTAAGVTNAKTAAGVTTTAIQKAPAEAVGAFLLKK